MIQSLGIADKKTVIEMSSYNLSVEEEV